MTDEAKQEQETEPKAELKAVDSYEKRTPLRLRIKEAVEAQRKTVQYTIVDVPGGRVELRPPTIAAFRNLTDFQTKDDGEIDPMLVAMGVAMFMCFDPDTGDPVWQNTPETIAWFEDQDLTGWLNDLASKGADVLKAAHGVKDAKKN